MGVRGAVRVAGPDPGDQDVEQAVAEPLEPLERSPTGVQQRGNVVDGHDDTELGIEQGPLLGRAAGAELVGR